MDATIYAYVGQAARHIFILNKTVNMKFLEFFKVIQFITFFKKLMA